MTLIICAVKWRNLIEAPTVLAPALQGPGLWALPLAVFKIPPPGHGGHGPWPMTHGHGTCVACFLHAIQGPVFNVANETSIENVVHDYHD